MIEKGLTKISHSQRRALLRERLSTGRLVVAPGVFEMVSAKIADRMGFDALYMTGYGTVASYLGLPDAGLATYTDMVNRVSQFTSITHTPMICDGDTGYGGLLNVMHTVRGYEVRRPGIPQKVRAHAGQAGDSHARHGRKDSRCGRNQR